MEIMSYAKNPTIVLGKVMYEDRTPVRGAVVILQKILIDNNVRSEEFMEKYNHMDMAFAITNEFGEFTFSIIDKRNYYKIKVFNNDKINHTQYGKIIIDI